MEWSPLVRRKQYYIWRERKNALLVKKGSLSMITHQNRKNLQEFMVIRVDISQEQKWNKFVKIKYKFILSKIILSFAIQLRLYIFQQENKIRGIHIKITSEWFKQKKVRTMKWFSQSPGLNPIEHLGACIENHSL